MGDRDEFKKSLDDRLIQFLDDRDDEKSKGLTLHRLANMILKHDDDDKKFHAELTKTINAHQSKIDEHNNRLVTVETRLEDLKETQEVTGQHNVSALTMAAEARGMAMAPRSKHNSIPPIFKAVGEFFEHKITHIIVATVFLGIGWIIRHLGIIK